VFTQPHCLDALVKLRAGRQRGRVEIICSLAVLAHDFSPSRRRRTKRSRMTGGVSSRRTRSGGRPLGGRFLERINAPLAVRERVIPW